MNVRVPNREGNTAVIETAWATNAAENHTYLLRGPDGGARLDILEDELTIYETAGEDGLFDSTVESTADDSPRYHDPDHYPLLEKGFAHFLECVEAGASPEYGTLDRSLRIQRAIDRIYDAVDG